jgi:hypothetical protein
VDRIEPGSTLGRHVPTVWMRRWLSFSIENTTATVVRWLCMLHQRVTKSLLLRVAVITCAGLVVGALAQPADPDRWLAPSDGPPATGRYETNPDKACKVAAPQQSTRLPNVDDHCMNAETALIRAQEMARNYQDTVENARHETGRLRDHDVAYEGQQAAAAQKAADAQGDYLDECFADAAKHYASVTPVDAAQACTPLDSQLDAYRQALAKRPPNRRAQWLVDMITTTNVDLKRCASDATKAHDDMVASRERDASTKSVDALAKIPAADRLPVEQQRIDDFLAQCRNDVAAKRDERLGIVATRPLGEIVAIPPSERLPEEQQRIDDEAAKRKASIEAHRSDKKWTGPLLSSAICFCGQAKAAAADEIKTEKSYAAQYGGIVDKEKLYNLQLMIRSLDETSAATRDLMRKLRVSSLSCSDKTVKLLVACLPFGQYQGGGGANEACKTKQVDDFAELVDLIPWVEAE